MLVKFLVDLRAAVRSGINATRQVILDVDPAQLTQGERDLLASRLTQQGEVVSRRDDGCLRAKGGYVYDSIEELAARRGNKAISIVTANGTGIADLIIAIANEESAITGKKLAAEAKAKADAEQSLAAKEQRVADMLAKFAADPTTAVYDDYGTLRLVVPLRDPIDDPRLTTMRQWADAHCARINAERKAMKDEAAAEEKERHDAGIAELRQWASAHGSDLLAARIADGYEWIGLAEREWAAQQVCGLGAECDRPGDCDENERTTPTLPEIQKLRHVRSLLDSTHATAKLVWCVYTVENDDEYGSTGDTSEVKRAEVKVTVTCPTGREIEYWYVAG